MSLKISSNNKPLARSLLLLGLFIGFPLHAEEEASAIPAYIELKPDFVVNHQANDTSLKYIKTSISIRTQESQKALIEANIPLVRDALVMFLSARTKEQVSGAIAREKTREEAAAAVNSALEEETGRAPVQDILFTSFVTQQ
ncbi:flagellar basal body protein FliL [Marinomonas sp. M1K-6]|uniref:Flagellar protein FliL n=1 Tax=Marinomonas profundi TaxID=2726122 RepID=A0A847R6G4_9GAMM|nr:flagellar basal body-associated FliL family protein [Marinomonas profundi]NLQ18083.1 flagellar basal body protein FliL [Marinomonas profundi]UDV04131.1 flagellar basal body-associated FliL family protein [Marinomonas profundi]